MEVENAKTARPLTALNLGRMNGSDSAGGPTYWWNFRTVEGKGIYGQAQPYLCIRSDNDVHLG